MRVPFFAATGVIINYPRLAARHEKRKTLTIPDLPERIAFLGDYPPRLCGIATFTQDLCEAVAGEAPASRCFWAR